MSDGIKRKGLSEVEIALTDAIKTVLEFVIHAHPGAEKYLSHAFEHQRDRQLQTKQPDAAALSEILRRFVVDPVRQTNREEVRRLLAEPPQGRA